MPVYHLPDLPYDYGDLEPAISGEIMELHHGAHHAAYVKGANTTLERIEQARAERDFSNLPGLERTMAFHLAGHLLHSMFWTNLSPEGGGRPAGALAAAIDEYFGDFDSFQAEMNAAAASVQGAGWAALSWDPLGVRLVVTQIHDHHITVAPTTTPILVFDTWEHAFYLQYRNVKTDYIDRLWSLIDWSDVADRFEVARRGTATSFLTPATGATE